jgi:hypothetical protein
LTALADGGQLSRPGQPIALAEVNAAIQQALRTDESLVQVEAGGQSLESGFWGLSIGQEQASPLPDRVEVEIVRFLARHPESTLSTIESDLYPKFPGLQAPPRAVVRAVLDSYALEVDGVWRLRPEDAPSARRASLQEMTALLRALGGRLAYRLEEPEPHVVLWQGEDGLACAFHLTASAIAGRFFAHSPHPRERCLLVLPGGRASLLAYKLRRDPALRQAAAGWRFVKFRLVRALADVPLLTRQTWDEQVNSDPIEHTPGQMMMF